VQERGLASYVIAFTILVKFRQGEKVMRQPTYYANINLKGPVKYGKLPGSIGVLESLDNCTPIGEGSCKTWNERGVAIWTLRIGGQEISGRWIILDRLFEPVE
jgi:hypothetical protein